jgi:outer membrane PBP1 activator LpoA protein
LTLGGCTGLPRDQAQNIRGGYAAGDKVTVILPTMGPVADAADAVREGVRAALGADNTAVKPTLAFAAGDEAAKVADTLGDAAKAGTTHVIGPLQKPAVDALAQGPALKVPTLALNQSTLGGKAAANLYQFALAPDTEAAEVANKAHSMGFSRALMLYPQGEAGSRRADAFRSQWKRLGGTVAAESAFDPGAKSFQGTVTKLLGSQADFVFLAADAAQARQIYPLIRGGASALPVIATPDVYPGDADRARDKELTGLYFVDLPWLLGVGADQDPLARSKMRRGSAYLATPLGLRLYAMGIDAYRLAPRLSALAKSPSANFPGETGTLSIDSQGRVQRKLSLGRFTQSGVQAVAGVADAKVGIRASRATPESDSGASVQPAPVAHRTPKPEPRKTGSGSAG